MSNPLLIDRDHMSPAQKRAYVIADNRLAPNAGWDEELLALELKELLAVGGASTPASPSPRPTHFLKGLQSRSWRHCGTKRFHPSATALPGGVWMPSRHRLVLLGIAKSLLAVSTALLVGGARAIVGFITGSPYVNERTLDVSVLTDVRPRIETMPLEEAQAAYDSMLYGDVTFRRVLTMGDRHAHQ